jgi:hypothetical protein
VNVGAIAQCTFSPLIVVPVSTATVHSCANQMGYHLDSNRALLVVAREVRNVVSYAVVHSRCVCRLILINKKQWCLAHSVSDLFLLFFFFPRGKEGATSTWKRSVIPNLEAVSGAQLGNFSCLVLAAPSCPQLISIYKWCFTTQIYFTSFSLYSLNILLK